MIVILEFFRKLPGENDPVVLATEKGRFETVKAAVLCKRLSDHLCGKA